MKLRTIFLTVVLIVMLLGLFYLQTVHPPTFQLPTSTPHGPNPAILTRAFATAYAFETLTTDQP
jgi:hypothetical protein